MPDDLTGHGARPEPDAHPPAEPPSTRPPRRPSWRRAALVSLAILAAGATLGTAWYRQERGHDLALPTIERTSSGWRIAVRSPHDVSGLDMDGSRLVWQQGLAIEYADLQGGEVRLLGPGPGMHEGWAPSLQGRYAVWLEAKEQASTAEQVIAYDTSPGRRWTLAEADPGTCPSVSGDIVVWCSNAEDGEATLHGVRIGSGRAFEVALGAGTPALDAGTADLCASVVSGTLVVWATEHGPFTVTELASGVSRPVIASLSSGWLTGVALAGRTLVWGQATAEPRSGVVAAVDVDGGGTIKLVDGLTGLTGPAYDGRTAVWAQQTSSGYRVMGCRVVGRRIREAGPFVIAVVDGEVGQVAVSGNLVAWIERSRGSTRNIVIMELPK